MYFVTQNNNFKRITDMKKIQELRSCFHSLYQFSNVNSILVDCISEVKNDSRILKEVLSFANRPMQCFLKLEQKLFTSRTISVDEHKTDICLQIRWLMQMRSQLEQALGVNRLFKSLPRCASCNGKGFNFAIF